jgi:hypothetical protein
MKLFSALIATTSLLVSFNSTVLAGTPPTPCQQGEAPKVIKPMADYDIIATNVGSIEMGKVFSGNHLTYSVKAKPANKNNTIKINKDTGMVAINAEKKDKFDVIVKATNPCGSVTNKFNVIIDEDE